MKANFGCGKNILDGYDNYDKYSNDKRVVNIDFNILPLKISDDYYKEIIMYHFLEHLNINKFDFMNEVHRISKDDAVIKIKLPQFASLLGHTNNFHSRHYLNCITKDMNADCLQHKKLFIEKRFYYSFVGIKRDFPFIKFDLNWILKK